MEVVALFGNCMAGSGVMTDLTQTTSYVNTLYGVRIPVGSKAMFLVRSWTITDISKDNGLR